LIKKSKQSKSNQKIIQKEPADEPQKKRADEQPSYKKELAQSLSLFSYTNH
jgi:hypothetical protein